MDITVALIYQPIFNLIVVLYRLLGNNLGLAIIAIGVLARIITIPIIVRQRKMLTKNKEYSKKVNEVKEKYKNDKEKQQKELMALQSEFLPSQLAGCLPLIIQLIVFYNIYTIIRSLILSGVGSFNSIAYPFVPAFAKGYVINYNFLGIFDLGKIPSQLANSGLLVFLPYILLVLGVAVSQYFTTKFTMNPAAMGAQPKLASKEEERSKKGKKQKDTKPEPTQDFSEAMQKSMQQTMILFPLLYAYLTYSTFQAGLALYLIITNLFVIIQTLILNRQKKTANEEKQGLDTNPKNLNIQVK